MKQGNFCKKIEPSLERSEIVLSSPLCWFGGALALLAYLYFGTGIHSDDYSFLEISRNWTLWDLLTLYKAMPVFFYALPARYFEFSQFYFIGYREEFYDIAKILISLFAIYSAWLFSSQYIGKQRAFLFSLFFVLYPLHDANNYWLVGAYMFMTGAWIMLAHVYINRERNLLGVILGFVGAFWSYASPPLTCGLSLTFLMTREYKKFILFVIPEGIYIIYYFGISRFLEIGEFRTSDIRNSSNLWKQLLIQVGSFLDSAIGPSFWLKFYYSILSLTWLSFVVASLAALFYWKLYLKDKPSFSKPLLIVFAGTTLCGFFIFAVTGKFPQIAFGLGDRTTYYGSLLLALLIISIPWKKNIALMVFFFMSLSITGLSEHWKSWNVQQHKVIESVRNSSELKRLHAGDILWVSGNQYSQLGPISHIEFFAESYLVRDIFCHALNSDINYSVSSLNHRYHWENGIIKDSKYGASIPVGNRIIIYDSQNNNFVQVTGAEINKYINALPHETRHWMQLVPQGWLKNAIVYLMPRLEYLFNS